METETESETKAEERALQEGLPEREPEMQPRRKASGMSCAKRTDTIGEALKKYYEEQLSHSGLKTETGRKAFLLKLLADHSMALN